MLGIEPWALSLLGEHFVTELHSSVPPFPQFLFLFNCFSFLRWGLAVAQAGLVLLGLSAGTADLSRSTFFESSLEGKKCKA
jgi:hypothetical protein